MRADRLARYGGCRITVVCAALELARATFYRFRNPRPASHIRPRPRPKNRLSDQEGALIRSILSEERFVDRTPREIVPILADEGVYLGSIRTFYRILSADGTCIERRLQARHPAHVAPVLEASRPNQVWTWDITRLKGPWRGSFYFLYVMLDIYSRYVVGWMLAERENARRAQHFIREVVGRHLQPGQKLAIHNDRGSPMKAGGTTELIKMLGLEHSFSRPRTSDDNPFSEAHFRTLKYHSSFPEFFGPLDQSERFLDRWFTWYNEEHRHTGLNLHTPASVYQGTVAEVVRKRQEVMDLAYQNNPGRFSNGKPVVKYNPPIVGINLHLKIDPLVYSEEAKQNEMIMADIAQP
jgi:transposase InsO family protein